VRLYQTEIVFGSMDVNDIRLYPFDHGKQALYFHRIVTGFT
jgi:hypothetical protein